MKKLKALKLNSLAVRNLSSKEMKAVKGGYNLCSCSCYWAGSGGGSSSNSNCMANALIPTTSNQGSNSYTCRT